MSILQYRNFYTKQKIFSWKDKNIIYDPNSKKSIGYFYAKKFSVFRTYWLKEINDNIILTIKEKFSLSGKYEFYIGNSPDIDKNQYFGYLKKSFSIKPKYTMFDSKGKKNFEIKGNLFLTQYVFYRSKQEIAQVSRKFFSIPDILGIKILNNIDDNLTLMILGGIIAMHNEFEINQNK